MIAVVIRLIQGYHYGNQLYFIPLLSLALWLLFVTKEGVVLQLVGVLYNGNNDNDDDIKMFIVESFD